MVPLPPFGNHLSTAIGTKLRTNDQIRNFIDDKIAKFRARSMSQKEEGSFPQVDYMSQYRREELHQASTSFMDQQHLNFAKLEEKGCPQVLPEDTVTLAKSKEKSLLVPSDISTTTWDKVPDECPSSTLSWNSSQKVQKSQLHGRNDFGEQDVGIDSTGVGSSNITKNSEDKQHSHFTSEGNVHASEQSLNKSCSSCSGEEFEHQLSPKCDGARDFGGQIGSCFGLEDEFECQTDDEDDDWEVILLNIDHLRFEQAEYQPNPENILQSKCEDEVRFATKAVPASAFLKMEVFETPDEQKQTVKCGQLSFVVPSSRCSHESFRQRKDSSSEHEDCSETDDSADYSPAPEINYLTVSKNLMKSISAAAKPKTDHSEFEKENYEMASLQEGQASGRAQSSQEESIIIIDSDSESDTDCMEKQERDKICLPVDQQHHVNTDSTRGTEKCGLNQNKNGWQKISNDEDIIILSDSDDDDYRELSNRAKETSILESMDGGNSEMAKNALQNEKPLANSLKPRPDHTSEHEKLKTGKEVMHANGKFHESKKKANKVSKEKKRVASPEGEDDDNDLHNARSDLSAKRKRVKTTVYSPRSNQTSERLSEPETPLGDNPMSIQTSHLSRDKGRSSSDPSKATSKKDSITSKLKRHFRDKQNKKTKPPGVYNAAAVKSDQSSSQPRRRVVSPKHQRAPSATSYSPFAPQNGTSPLTTTKSVQGTSNARTKIRSDWQKQHIPLRRERKFHKEAKRLKRTL